MIGRADLERLARELPVETLPDLIVEIGCVAAVLPTRIVLPAAATVNQAALVDAVAGTD